jgi:hypothetical protein
MDAPPTCWRCGGSLLLQEDGDSMVCCGFGYRYRKVGNWENVEVSEKKFWLYQLAPLITLSLLVATSAYLAYSFTPKPGPSDFLSSTFLVVFEFTFVFLFVKGASDWYRKEKLPIQNNELARILLISAIATFVLGYGIANEWLPASECTDTRYFSTC